MYRTLLALAAAGLFAGEASASPALTTMPAIMHATPSPRGREVQEIPARAQIDVLDCGQAWCHVSWRNLFGYVSIQSVQPLGPGPGPEPLYGGPVPPPVVVAPFWGWGPRYYGFGWGYGWHRHW